MKAYASAFLDFFEKSFKMDAFGCYTCSMMLVYISNSFANHTLWNYFYNTASQSALYFIDAHFSIRPKIAFYVLQKGILGKLVKNVAKTILKSIVFKTIADIPKQLIACVMAGSSHFEAFC